MSWDHMHQSQPGKRYVGLPPELSAKLGLPFNYGATISNERLQQVMDYLQVHGLNRTAEHFSIAISTIQRYECLWVYRQRVALPPPDPRTRVH